MHLSLEVALRATMQAGDDLVRAAQAVPAPYQLWRPTPIGRHTAGILAHCAATNRFLAATIAGQPLPYQTREERDGEIAACDTLEKAVQFARSSVSAVCDAIAALPEERLAEPMVMPWGERRLRALGLLAAALHMHYHEGQINQIQLLLGDDDYH